MESIPGPHKHGLCTLCFFFSREYERDLEAGRTAGGSTGTPDSGSLRLTLSAREKFIEFKKNSGRRLVSMKNQLAGRYK